MAAFDRRLSALILVAIATAALAFGQEGKPEARRGDRGRHRAEPQKQAPADEAVSVREDTKRRSAPVEKMPNAEVVVLPLEHANPWEVADVLSAVRTTCEQRLLIRVLGGGALVVASDDDKVLAEVRALVAKLDRPLTPTVQTRLDVCKAVPLKSAYAPEVADFLMELSPPGRPIVRVVADKRANTVWIAGGQHEVDRLAEVAQKMDKNTSSTGRAEAEGRYELRFHTLAKADTAMLAKTLGRLARTMDLEAEVVAAPLSGMLIIHAAPGEHAQLEKIIEKLDVPTKRPQRPAPASRGPADDG